MRDPGTLRKRELKGALKTVAKKVTAKTRAMTDALVKNQEKFSIKKSLAKRGIR